jgi:hypothetical protein
VWAGAGVAAIADATSTAPMTFANRFTRTPDGVHDLAYNINIMNHLRRTTPDFPS